MFLLKASRHLNRWLGPFLLKHGVRLRRRWFLPHPGADQPYVDAAVGVTLGQWLTALEAHEQADDVIRAMQQSQQKAAAGSSSLDQEGIRRVQVLDDDYVRPALMPHQVWSDVADYWQFYPRLLRWLRQQYLYARFGPHVQAVRRAYPALAQSPQFRSATTTTTNNKDNNNNYYARLPQSALVQASLCTAPAHDEPQNDNDEKHKAGPSRRHHRKPSSSSSSRPRRRPAADASWATTKRRDRVVQSLRDVRNRFFPGENDDTHTTVVVRGGALAWTVLPPDADLTEVPLADVLHLVGAPVRYNGPLNAWLEQRNQFQLWTQEYIAQLGDYLYQRQQGRRTTTVLEVGAGDGLLTACLQDYVQQHYYYSDAAPTTQKDQQPPRRIPHFVATDDASWSIPTKAPVQRMDYRQALAQPPQYWTHMATTRTNEPDDKRPPNHHIDDHDDDQSQEEEEEDLIVVCSWMPMMEDWTAAFRQNPRVVEYILIGEADDGQCGDHWQTWGNPHFLDRTDDDDDGPEKPPSTTTTTIPPFQADGFSRHDLSFLHPYQFSRYDSSLSKEGSTVSFRRTVRP